MTQSGRGGAAALVPRAHWADAVRARLDPVGVLVAALIAATLVFAPFVTLRANRIAPGTDLGLFAAFPASWAALACAAWVAGGVFAVLRTPPAWRMIVGAALALTLAALVGTAPAHLVSADQPYARVSVAAGPWLLLFAFGVMIADGAAKRALSPLARVAALAVAVAAIAVPLAAGWWDSLSVMREYAVRAATFRQEASRHLELVGGSVGAAVLAGVPLGVGCVRLPALRAACLPVLNIVQTIPSIAMYGLLMVPLGLFAAHVPLAAALGIGGIGLAPALAALFLYALLPVASSVIVGLEQVPRDVTEAAAAMGMTSRQRLVSVELPLALPVVLSGVRIVLVQNIGLAAVAALIGGGGFGTFIFQGIGQSATDLVLLGAIPTIALALFTAVLFEAAIALAKGARP